MSHMRFTCDVPSNARMELNNLRHRDDFRTDVFVKLLGICDVRQRALPAGRIRGWRSASLRRDGERSLRVSPGEKLAGALSPQIESVDQVHSIVAQVILAVAIAEEAMQFEHRDLQMDNVLVKMTSNETAVFIYNKKRIVLHTRGVVACVIDFNLSRATIGEC
ncbi:hypothetical protein HPB48_001915 [Haemaphysalis longicornis]|uniref:Protein kinase domain-containing protein n=1 Tax=Haemaphysalis longicornis TaxID=44386 RepID=A0A9J6FV61_HAELO|nr:hypothetical protein HPB48_001915 [Haemaphysalis longicornis]